MRSKGDCTLREESRRVCTCHILTLVHKVQWQKISYWKHIPPMTLVSVISYMNLIVNTCKQKGVKIDQIKQVKTRLN